MVLRTLMTWGIRLVQGVGILRDPLNLDQVGSKMSLRFLGIC